MKIEDLFEKGGYITTNEENLMLVLDVNETDVCCKDVLTGDFHVMGKTTHAFKKADLKVIFKKTLEYIIDEVEITEKDRTHILEQMGNRIDNWL